MTRDIAHYLLGVLTGALIVGWAWGSYEAARKFDDAGPTETPDEPAVKMEAFGIGNPTAPYEVR